jgi:hypothetical protein
VPVPVLVPPAPSQPVALVAGRASVDLTSRDIKSMVPQRRGVYIKDVLSECRIDGVYLGHHCSRTYSANTRRTREEALKLVVDWAWSCESQGLPPKPNKGKSS